MSNHDVEERGSPTVLIVGGGLGGLLLGVLLERMDIPYNILERATKVQPLGSAMALGANILPVFEQLGMLKEIEEISRPLYGISFYNGSLHELGTLDFRVRTFLTGYYNLIFARSKLYDILLKRIPTHKIKMGKRVLRTEERDGRVCVFCSDNSTYEGSIVIGADGAYSGVRQSLYRQMDEIGMLPLSDMEDFTIGYVTMVGVASPPRPEKYKQLKDNFSHYSQVLGGNKRSWGVTSVANNQICWTLSIQLSLKEAKALHFRSSGWGPETNDVMLKEFYDLPCPWGGKMAEIFDATPKDMISKVFLEEKLFETWHHGRTVLVGDACHKMLPGTGIGGADALQDAVVLTNCIHNMPDWSSQSIKAAFEEYHQQRFERVEDQFQRSGYTAKIMCGQTWSERISRFVMLKLSPDRILERAFANVFEYRPQIAWLPLIENRGTIPVLPQEGRRTFFGVQREETQRTRRG
ncbi:hypothetical protein EDD21DRAFT_120347 [Dissophora ornata]|nr:hypothetical protein BGZ58_000616 [Dissophora ornata]KAI8605667.1 hypothetical protein EDD21DRAFT_120347 [Dissophora ornata]